MKKHYEEIKKAVTEDGFSFEEMSKLIDERGFDTRELVSEALKDLFNDEKQECGCLSCRVEKVIENDVNSKFLKLSFKEKMEDAKLFLKYNHTKEEAARNLKKARKSLKICAEDLFVAKFMEKNVQFIKENNL